MSEETFRPWEPELAALLDEWMREAGRTDQEEDDEHGPDQRGDELPEHIRQKMKKLLKMREAMARLEEEAKAERVKQRRDERENGC